jgi:hypothetical protein
MSTSLTEPTRLSANQRLLHNVQDAMRNRAMNIFSASDRPVSGAWILRRIGVVVPADIERHVYERAARAAFVVALVEEGTTTLDTLFARTREVFRTTHGYGVQTPQTKPDTPAPVTPPASDEPSDEEIEAVLIGPDVLMHKAEYAALWRIWNDTPYPPSGTKEYEREKKSRHRARNRIRQLREAGLMTTAIEALRQVEERIEERVYERVVQRLGLDAADSLQAYLAGREDEARESVFREPFEDVRGPSSTARKLDPDERDARDDLRRHGLL